MTCSAVTLDIILSAATPPAAPATNCVAVEVPPVATVTAAPAITLIPRLILSALSYNGLWPNLPFSAAADVEAVCKAWLTSPNFKVALAVVFS